jgi:transposase
LFIVPGTVNADVYRGILERFLQECSDRLPPNWLFQDDNAPPHRAQIVDQFKRDRGIRSLPWPACSPDLNPIEHVWDYIGRRVQEYQLPAANAAELSARLNEAWGQVPVAFVHNLVVGMTRRVEAVIRARGGNTRY